SRGPGGTTSVWPASTTRGRAVPCRIQRLVTSPHLNVSALNPSGTRRSMMSCWQPSSAGGMDLRRVRGFASASVSFFMGSVRRGRFPGRERGAVAARIGGAHSCFDVAAQVRTHAQHEERLGAYEKGPDQQLLHVVVEGGLHALVLVAEELQRP